ncbi:MAG: PadR family transcriptional regulator [Gammaproteobacteria bacterium]|nr:PadR family transcriptional regulator [Gammaproteobacteria bacterium]
MTRQRKCSPQTLSLLAVLLERPRSWRYGYDLSTETGLKSGSLYPILMRLGDRGVLDSKWQESPERGRPPRHMYRLSTAGAVYAREQLASHAADDDIALPKGSRA